MALATKNKKMRMTTNTSDDSDSSEWEWAFLPNIVLDEILDRLVALGDYVRFPAVCKAWLSTALEDWNYRGSNQKNKRKWTSADADRFFERQLPMLMLPHWDDHNRACFYSVTNKKVLNFNLSVPYSERFIGSSFGWLISVDNELSITLFNPFSRERILLPPVIFVEDGLVNREDFLVKAVLSADPSYHPYEFIVMLIYGNNGMLAFIRPGGGDNMKQKRWVIYSQPRGFCDVIYSKIYAAFYALHCDGQVFMIDPYSKSVGSFAPSLIPEPPCKCRYIVQTESGDLLQVLRYMGQDATREFKVFKLNWSSSSIPYWVELKSLGDDQVLFVGDGSSSLSVRASDFPGCQPGSIYFSLRFSEGYPDFRVEEPNDMGCVKLQSGMQQPIEHFNISYWGATHKSPPTPPPIWVVPTFQEAEAKRPDWSLGYKRIKFGWMKKNQVNPQFVSINMVLGLCRVDFLFYLW